MKKLKLVNVLSLLVIAGGMTFVSGQAMAQMNADPSTLPLPDFNRPDPNRALVITVQFHSPTDVALQNILVANVRAKGSLGAPPLIKIELLDRNGVVIREQNDWHPLWIREWESDEVESSPVLNSGPGAFYIPLSANLAAVRISDIVLAQELITVDVTATVDAFCATIPLPPICLIFRDGFE